MAPQKCLPDGHCIYRAAADYNREGAAKGAIVFRPREPAAPRVVIILPGKSADDTKAVRRGVEWTAADGELAPPFVAPDGKRRAIRATLEK
ncbi:MAG: hypothetical protein IT426_15600 [Pirellulales bacterium]|nr:hypothetical protein [Pirellulales bacterium]